MPFRLSYALRPSRRKTARITLAFGGGVFLGQQEKALSRAYLDEMLMCLTRINIRYLQAYPDTPRIMDLARAGKLLYMEEPPGQEDWQDIPTCIHMERADCEDMACWVAAERTVVDGKPTMARWKDFTLPDGQTLFHIIAEGQDGVIIDPSKLLGMH